MEKPANTLGRPVPEHSQRFLAASRERVKANLTSSKQENWTTAFFELYRDCPLAERQARSMAYALTKLPVIFLPEEQITGMLYQACPGAASIDAGNWNREDAAELDAAMVYNRRIRDELPELFTLAGNAESWISPVTCSPAHIGWHYDWILRDGINGMLERIRETTDRVDDRGRETLAAMRIALQAVLTWNNAHLDALEDALENTEDPQEKQRLQNRLAVCRRVPRHGARNFDEAVQSFHFSYTCTMFEAPEGGNGPGRLDYYLWPYLEKDLESGNETLVSAREKIDELFIRIHERMRHGSDGHVETIVVGGCHPDGSSAENPLAKIMIESIAGLGISHPSVYIRLPEKASEDFLEFAARDLVEGGNRAQIVCDSAIVPAVMGAGIEIEDARMYMCGGCMEISPHGMNSDLLFAGFFNVGKILELVLTGGICLNTGKRMLNLERDLRDFASFEELYTAFENELRRVLTLSFKRMDIASETWGKLRPRFLLSSQIEDCIGRGRAINDGGAKFEHYGSTPLAIPNTGDSLTALDYALFSIGKFSTPEEMLTAIQTNFENHEALRLRLRKLPKFGQGNGAADAMVNRVLGSVCDTYDNFTNRLGGRVKPMIMSFRMAPITGMALGASPDGRRAKTPIAQGLTPQSIAMNKGISTAIHSANSLNLQRFSGGASNMWDLDPAFATIPNVKSLLAGFAATGGQMFQGNMTDIDELRKAQKEPEKYSNMLVRVGGFSARFVALSIGEQNEILERYRHSG